VVSYYSALCDGVALATIELLHKTVYCNYVLVLIQFDPIDIKRTGAERVRWPTVVDSMDKVSN
jgi:hypothetical protein